MHMPGNYTAQTYACYKTYLVSSDPKARLIPPTAHEATGHQKKTLLLNSTSTPEFSRLTRLCLLIFLSSFFFSKTFQRFCKQEWTDALFLTSLKADPHEETVRRPNRCTRVNISCLSSLELGTTQLFLLSFVFRRLQGKQLETFGKTSHEIARAICSNGVQPSSILLVQKFANPAGIADQAASIVCSCKQQRVRRRHG